MAPWGGCLARSPQCICRMAFCGRGLSRSTASLAAVLPQLWLTLQALPAGSFSDFQRDGRVPRASQHTHEHIQYFMHPNTCVHKVPRASQHTHTQAHTVPQASHTCMCVHMVFARPLLKHWTLRLPVAGSWLCFVFMSILGNLLIFGRNTSAL